MNAPYDFRPLDADDREIAQTAELLAKVYRHSPYLTTRYLSWQYRDNPDGAAMGINAWAGEQLVGHVAGMPLVADLEGERRRGVFLLNAAVHPDHIRRSIMRTITQESVREAERLGYDFCIGMGNQLSTRLFLRDYDTTPAFLMVAPLDARIGFGPVRRRERDFAPSFARFWSDEALRWRVANPERPYTIRRSGGRLQVLAPTGRVGIGAWLHDAPDEGQVDPAGAPGTGPARVWLGLDPSIDWGRSAYVPIPRRLRPSPLNFVYKPLRDVPARIDPARAVFRGIDFDPF